jgi:16S rRNA (adenine1518-N6/adenine1519-N6)-dimethyltransferase
VSAPDDPLGARCGRRPPWSAFRSALDAAGFRPSKTLGQNFLVDPNAARAIALDARLPEGAHVLEVGAGCGFLSVHLAELGVALLAAEIDVRLLAVARRLLAGYPNVRWWLGDVLDGKHALAPGLTAELPGTAPWHLVSNLPYSIAAPLLAVLARLPNPPRSMTVLVQDEVAERLAARPGSAAWGALPARLGLLYEARAGRALGPQLFWPRPRVASRVVELSFRPLEGLAPGETAAFDQLVEVLFQQRRKQLLTLLADQLGDRRRAEDWVREAGLAPRARPETLGIAELLSLVRAPHGHHHPGRME